MVEVILKKRLLIILFFAFLMLPACAEVSESPVFEMYIQKQMQIKDSRGLIRAIVADDRKFIKEQLVNGLNPDTTAGSVPLIFFPIYLNNPEMLSLFLEFGANPNKTLMGESPLNFAIYRNSKDSMLELIKNGANINSKNLGKTPLDWALKEKKYDTAKYLIENGANLSKKNIKKINKLKNSGLIKYTKE